MRRWWPVVAGLVTVWAVAGRGWMLAGVVCVAAFVWLRRGDSRAERRRRPWTLVERKIVLGRAGYRCQDCGSPHELEVDHFMPIALGGEHSLRNARCLCGPCNRRKGSTHPEVYYR